MVDLRKEKQGKYKSLTDLFTEVRTTLFEDLNIAKLKIQNAISHVMEKNDKISIPLCGLGTLALILSLIGHIIIPNIVPVSVVFYSLMLSAVGAASISLSSVGLNMQFPYGIKNHSTMRMHNNKMVEYIKENKSIRRNNVSDLDEEFCNAEIEKTSK